MNWLGTDLNLLEADAEQLRRHLTWLLEDLRAGDAERAVEAAEVAALVAEVADCLARLATLDGLLVRVRSAVRQDAPATGPAGGSSRMALISY